MLSSRTCVPERQHADLRAGHVDGLPGDEHGRARGRGLDGQQGGHHLREAGDAHAQIGVSLPQHLAGREVEQQPRARRVAEGDLHGSRCGAEMPASASAGAASGRPSAELRGAVAALARPLAALACAAVARALAPTRWRGPSPRGPRRAGRARPRRRRSACAGAGVGRRAAAAVGSGPGSGTGRCSLPWRIAQRADDANREQHEDEDGQDAGEASVPVRTIATNVRKAKPAMNRSAAASTARRVTRGARGSWAAPDAWRAGGSRAGRRRGRRSRAR